MDKQDVFEIAIKLTGVYCLFRSLAEIPHAVLSLIVDYSQYHYSKTIYVLIACAPPLLLFALSLVFIVKGSAIAEFLGGHRNTHDARQADEASLPHLRLSFWVVLVGIFNFVSSLPVLISRLPLLVPMHNDPQWWSQVMFHGAAIGLSMVCIFKSHAIERIIDKKS